MTSDPRLERYLTALERVLQPFPVSDRAEIVTEIKSHVLSALERDPQANLDAILQALGEPETVANRYLLERGLKPAKPSISPIVKWVVIGFLATIAMMLIFAGFVVSRFSPLVDIDEKKDKVSLLGGLIQVDGDEGEILVNGMTAGKGRRFDGNIQLGDTKDIRVKFATGKFEVSTTSDRVFSWECKGGGRNEAHSDHAAGAASLDLSKFIAVKCNLNVPEKTKLWLDGANGKVELDQPRFDADIGFALGMVEIDPDSSANYRYDINVQSGKTDTFTSSNAADAYNIKVNIGTGSVKNHD